MEPLLLDMPTEIVTDRLRLRVPRPGDGSVILPTVFASLPELKRWMPWATDDYDPATAEVWCRRVAAEAAARRQLPMLMFDTAGGHVGQLGAFGFDWTVPSCEIGYWLGTPHVGRGLMSEAVRALTGAVQEAFGFVRVELLIDATNGRSRRVAERCGYALEGVRRRCRRNTAGELADQCVYAVVR